MSDPSNVTSGAASSEAGRTATRKPRSPVERVIVWGGIIVLLGFVAAEARARKGYEWTLSALERELEKDEGANAAPLYVKNLDQHLLGWPKRTETESGSYRTISLTWGGLLPKSKYGIDLTCEKPDKAGGEPAVMSLVTHGAPEPEPPPTFTEEELQASATPGGMPGAGPGGSRPPDGGGPGGGGPGGGGFDPMQQDADGDKKISREEAQGRLKENFDRNDANADGFIDEDEIAAMRERFRNQAGGGGPGAGGGPNAGGSPFQEFGPGGQRPGRPPAESSDSTDKPAEPTSPESAPPDSTTKENTEAPPSGDKQDGEGAP